MFVHSQLHAGKALAAADSRATATLLILMGSYNGAEHIEQQLRSLQGQSVTSWKLLVRDDGSTDGTAAIVRQFAAKDPRIALVQDSAGRLGVNGNFGLLLEHADEFGADYVMFCDQDDVWHPDKIAEELDVIRQAESVAGRHVPLLAHSDLAIVDNELQPIHRSFMRFQNIRHVRRDPLKTLLVQNFVTGCSCLMNRALVELASPIPQEVVVHDWWVALCAAAAGEIHYLPHSTILYRQHGGNSVGARGFWESVNPLRKNWRFGSPEGSRAFRRSLDQARRLRDRLAERRLPGSDAALEMVSHYCGLFEGEISRFARVRSLLRLGIRRQDPVRQMLLVGRLLVSDPTHQSN